MRVQLIALVIGLLSSGCNPEKQSRKKIESLERERPDAKYEIGLASMQYICKDGEDAAYSKSLVQKLLDMGFFAEAIYAAELLLEKYPADPELFFLRGRAYQNQHQYGHAFKDLDHARTLSPGNTSFSSALASAKQEEVIWRAIQSLNAELTSAPDSFNILFERAEKFYQIRQYDAVLYDLGAISKMRAPEDSIYFTREVAALHKENRRPVERLSEMLKYFRQLKK
jgi:tetratricopeptide (TPR) repeat protein